MDRLFALMLGLQYRQVVTLRRVWVLVVAGWLYSSKSAIMVLYNLRISYSIFAIEVILCIIASNCCYTKIYRALGQNRAQVQHHVLQAQQNQGQNALNMARYKKTVSTALWVQIILVACYLPFATVVAVAFFLWPSSQPRMASPTNSYYVELDPKPNSLLLEDKGNEKSSEGQDQTIVLFLINCRSQCYNFSPHL